MGEQKIDRASEARQLRRFMQQLLREVQALERMLADGWFETGVRRIGAEQETCLVDRDLRPAPHNLEVLAKLDDPHFTIELGRHNVEFNLDPLTLDAHCLSDLEGQMNLLLGQLRDAAKELGLEVVLAGILPTMEVEHLALDFMTPVPRFYALNDAIARLRGGDVRLYIKGQDEIAIRHDNVMLEACTTSFQVHLQVEPAEFAQMYNIAQAIAAPVLACGANSPLLFGRRLWRETRIALFQQSVDTRLSTNYLRDQLPRVSFGSKWVEESVLEIFQENLARFRLLIATDTGEDPLDCLAAGRAPDLKALRLHNGTVYRWNRPCYGISPNGKPHLRIENRVLPAGPSILDEVASAALWLGLMRGVALEYGDITRRMRFGTAQENFVSAARFGVGAQLAWPLGKRKAQTELPVGELLLEHLAPLARRGLADWGVDAGDIDRYLAVVEERVKKKRTGSLWQLESLERLAETGTLAERLAAVTGATIARQKEGKPVARWELAMIEEGGGWARHYGRVGNYMTTDLFTVNEDELVDLVAAMMYWKHIRHVPVEDDQHRLVGLVTHRTLLRLLASGTARDQPVPVRDIMERELVTIAPEASTLDAIRLMREHKVACLPVVKGEHLVGIITERDFMNVARMLLEAELGK